MLLMIDGYNYDDYVVENTYEVNDRPEYGGTSYTDGWCKKHRTVVRTIVGGTVTLAMPPSAYNAFVGRLKTNAGVEGDHEVRLFINNQNELRTITAYVDVVGRVAIATKQFNNQKVFFNAIVTIEER